MALQNMIQDISNYGNDLVLSEYNLFYMGHIVLKFLKQGIMWHDALSHAESLL